MFNIFALILSLVALTVVTIMNYPYIQLKPMSTSLEYGLYQSLSRIVWSIALSYIIFACHHNHGGIVNWFLAHPFWQPLSQLSYSIYLMHFFVISNKFVVKAPFVFSGKNAVCSLLAMFFFSLYT